jgi:hypothetical protein
VLLSPHPHFSDAVAIAGMNAVWLAAISMLAWPIARLWSWGIHDTWDHPGVNVVARILYPLVAVCLLTGLWWVFSEQARELDGRLVSHWALFITLVHGTPELGAISVSVPLVLIAAFVEVYVTPHLLIPLQA